jgi:hypothetical protein
MTNTAPIDTPWFVFARLPSGETLVPGQTTGCPGPDAWGHCPAIDAGQQPGCAGATWLYGPEPSFKADVPSTSGSCPLVLLNPSQPLTEVEY